MPKRLEEEILKMLKPVTEETHDLGPAVVSPTDSLPDYSKGMSKMPVPTAKPSVASTETGSMKSSKEGDNSTSAAKSIEMKGAAASVVKEEKKEDHEDEAEDKKLIKKMMDKKEKEEKMKEACSKSKKEDKDEDEDEEEKEEEIKEAHSKSKKEDKDEDKDEDEEEEDEDKEMKEDVEGLQETQTFTISFKKGTSTVKTAVVTALDKGEAKRKANEMKKSTPSLKGTSSIITMKEENYFDVSDVNLSELFADQTELSEEFKTKASTIFESAVNMKVNQKVAELKEDYNKKLTEATNLIQEKVESTVDMYLSYVVENWIKENELAVENGLKNELFEDFLSGLKALFETHNVSIPQEKIDIAEKAVSELEEVNDQLDTLMSENAKLLDEVNSLKKNKVVSEAISGLTLTDSELLISLSKSVEFTSEEEFRKKLDILREGHCNKKEVSEPKKLVMEDVVEPVKETEVTVDNSMKRYMDSLSRISK